MQEITLIKIIKAIKQVQNTLSFLNFKIVDSHVFGNFNRTSIFNTSVGFTKKTVLKVENYKHDLKINDLKKEAEIIKYLNEKDCVSCPRLIKQGKSKGKDFIVLERINGTNNTPTADLLFAILEQKALGVWHGDIKPDNVIFDGTKAVLIDYDQAKIIPEIKYMDNVEYLYYIGNDLQNKWPEHLERYFNVKSVEEFVNIFRPYFNGSALNLGKTTLFKKQVTTQSDTGFYHTINTPEVFIQGMRDLESRKPILNNIPFKENEKILDFGCNAGLLSYYLHDRHCKVFGCDMDKDIIDAAKMISHIIHKDINFFKCDIDKERFNETFDTICLFSVIHHTKYMQMNAKFLASKCKRIIIECRLKEIGEKPTEKGWIHTSKWDFNSKEELYKYFENLFPNFKFEKNWGQGDRDRFIITLKK